MQTYPLKLTAAVSARVINTAANLFVYESAAAKTRTNVLLRSEEFDNATWLKTRATAVQAPAVLSPQGTATVEKLTEDATANSTHLLTQGPRALALGRWTYSIYAKAAERTQIQLGAWDTVTPRNASFNLATGQILAADPGTTARIADAGDGWWRCSITFDITANQFDAYIYLLSGGTGIYTGNGASGVYVWGAQAEQGEAATAYMRSGVDRGFADDYESRIIVKPGNGNDIALRPGQRFRLPPGETANQWQVRSYDGTTEIDGAFIIGSGEFEDSNTLNKFKLDASFSNSVQVTNTTGQRVPVTLDTAQTLPVSLSTIQINNTTAQRVPVTLDPAQVLNTSESVVAYTKTYSSNAPSTGAAIQILAPAENVNGVILHSFEVQNYCSGSYVVHSLIAKSTAPANATDGDVLQMHYGMTTQQKSSMNRSVVIPAGKGLWVIGGVENGAIRQALLQVL
jgi:hypothetical protein